MSNRIKVERIGKAIIRFEKSIEYINRKVDERSQSGKTNEDDDSAYRHYSGIAEDGGRCWSY